ncbi:MAG: hypothetical protein Q7S92_05215 [Candidatus Diapherotrites archaeon]|nr:hypothetical protein [Candidatus Diapherotrites archaeon]
MTLFKLKWVSLILIFVFISLIIVFFGSSNVIVGNLIGLQNSNVFSLSLTPVQGTVIPGSSVTTRVIASSTSQSVLGKPVRLSCSQLPAGVTCRFSPNSCVFARSVSNSPTLALSCASTLTVNSRNSTRLGTYPINVTGTVIGTTTGQMASYTLQVIPLDFSITVNPTTNLPISPGQTTSVSVNVNPNSLLSNTIISLACINLPQGVQCQFNPTSCKLSGNKSQSCSQLTIQTSASLSSIESLPITIQATAGAIQKTTIFNLNAQIPPLDFSVTLPRQSEAILPPYDGRRIVSFPFTVTRLSGNRASIVNLSCVPSLQAVQNGQIGLPCTLDRSSCSFQNSDICTGTATVGIMDRTADDVDTITIMHIVGDVTTTQVHREALYTIIARRASYRLSVMPSSDVTVPGSTITTTLTAIPYADMTPEGRVRFFCSLANPFPCTLTPSYCDLDSGNCMTNMAITIPVTAPAGYYNFDLSGTTASDSTTRVGEAHTSYSLQVFVE